MGDDGALHLLRLGPARQGQVEIDRGDDSDILEDLILFAPLLVRAVGNLDFGRAAAWIAFPDGDQAVCVVEGSGCRITAFNTLKMALVALIPRASARTLVRVKPGVFASSFRPKRTSCSAVSTTGPMHELDAALPKKKVHRTAS